MKQDQTIEYRQQKSPFQMNEKLPITPQPKKGENQQFIFDSNSVMIQDSADDITMRFDTNEDRQTFYEEQHNGNYQRDKLKTDDTAEFGIICSDKDFSHQLKKHHKKLKKEYIIGFEQLSSQDGDQEQFSVSNQFVRMNTALKLSLPSFAHSQLTDIQKFKLAKRHMNIEELLSLITSNETFFRTSTNDSIKGASQYYKNFREKSHISITSAQESNSQRFQQIFNSYVSLGGENKSDLLQEWMGGEQKICHCAINQLTYIIQSKRRELAAHICYNTNQQKEKLKDFIKLRKQILVYYSQTQTIEKQFKKFLLMGDETGIQAILYQLLIISDDDVMRPSKQIETLQKLSRNESQAVGSLNDLIKGKVGNNASVQSSPSNNKIQTSKIKIKQRKSWFKHHFHIIIDMIDSVLSDFNLNKNSKRVAILLLSNLYMIQKKMTRSYTKKEITKQKIENFFINNKDISPEEVEELYQTLLQIYSTKEIYTMMNRALGLDDRQLQKFIKAAESQSGSPSCVFYKERALSTEAPDYDIAMQQTQKADDQFVYRDGSERNGQLIRSNTYRFVKWGLGYFQTSSQPDIGGDLNLSQSIDSNSIRIRKLSNSPSNNYLVINEQRGFPKSQEDGDNFLREADSQIQEIMTVHSGAALSNNQNNRQYQQQLATSYEYIPELVANEEDTPKRTSSQYQGKLGVLSKVLKFTNPKNIKEQKKQLYIEERKGNNSKKQDRKSDNLTESAFDECKESLLLRDKVTLKNTKDESNRFFVGGSTSNEEGINNIGRDHWWERTNKKSDNQLSAQKQKEEEAVLQNKKIMFTETEGSEFVKKIDFQDQENYSKFGYKDFQLLSEKQSLDLSQIYKNPLEEEHRSMIHSVRSSLISNSAPAQSSCCCFPLFVKNQKQTQQKNNNQDHCVQQVSKDTNTFLSTEMQQNIKQSIRKSNRETEQSINRSSESIKGKGSKEEGSNCIIF